MSVNTTHHLIEDIEALRRHLAVERWLVSAGSWGSTLALAYAQRYPARVSELVLNTVTTSRGAELKWLYLDVARFFPDRWEQFRSHVPEASNDEGVIEAHAQRMENLDASIRLAAAREWCAWEDAVLSLEPRRSGTTLSAMPTDDMLAFVRICTRFLRHKMWLDDEVLIRNIGRLAKVPAVLIHGRRDVSCPVDTAWRLGRAWPSADLSIVDDAGHLSTDAKRAALLTALDRFAGR